ncbi:hypothetical protein QGN29_02755 [Temperatibacter marinus]|uniref:Uncharacterized protein n=1 Tax=Temperatibacter marinus TaxID=1456591 RepID=A0AA52EHJ9_9PROT|nr:hypothetical protein [Temperatibacter marinus]WND03288.1 hypothetical protein QGN29_02755 [Temperatibacter marinus]
MVASLEKILDLTSRQAYLLDGSELGLSSYGLMPDMESFEAGFIQAKEYREQNSEYDWKHLSALLKGKLEEFLEFEIEISEEQMEEHGIDIEDWEDIQYVDEAQEYLFKEVIAYLVDPFFFHDDDWEGPRDHLVEVMESDLPMIVRYHAAETLESLENFSVLGDALDRLIAICDSLDQKKEKFYLQEGFINTIVRILKDRFIWDEKIIRLFKRMGMYENLKDYTAYSYKTANWLIAQYNNCERAEPLASENAPYQRQGEGELNQGQVHKNLPLLKALACKWEETGGLYSFLMTLIKDDTLSSDAKALIVTGLFKNFPSNANTITAVNSLIQQEGHALSDITVIEIFGAYSDQDLPCKRHLIEKQLGDRYGRLPDLIRIYLQSYGLNEETLTFFEGLFEKYKDGQWTAILNAFLNNNADCEETRKIKRFYRQYI